MEKKVIVVGSRESKLAVVQANYVINLIKLHSPDIDVRLVTMKTTGDKILDKTLDKIGGKGLFVKELDYALLNGDIDIAVHSLKDMPAEIDDELPILAYSKRENPTDALVLPKGVTSLDVTKPIGSSSARRKIQLEELYEDVIVEPIRGNVISRLQKLDNGDFGALVLASAGLIRLGLQDRISKTYEIDEIIPSAGQGILAIQGRKDENYSFIEYINDELSTYSATAERAFTRTLGCGCTAPVAVYAEINNNEMNIKALYMDEETGKKVSGNISGSINNAEILGITLAKRLLKEVRI